MMKECFHGTCGLVAPKLRRRASLRAVRAHGATHTLWAPMCVFALVLALSQCTCAAYAQSNDIDCTIGVNMTGRTAVSYKFSNLGPNYIRLRACSTSGTCATDKALCNPEVAPFTSATLNMASDYEFLYGEFCSVALLGSCTVDQESWYKDRGGQWLSPLTTYNTHQMICTSRSDCSSGMLCLPSNGTAVPSRFSVCVRCPSADPSSACSGHGKCFASAGNSTDGWCHCDDKFCGSMCQGGCVPWRAFNGTSHNHSTPNPPPVPGSPSWKKYLLLGGIVGGATLVGLIIFVFVYRRQRKKDHKLYSSLGSGRGHARFGRGPEASPLIPHHLNGRGKLDRKQSRKLLESGVDNTDNSDLLIDEADIALGTKIAAGAYGVVYRGEYLGAPVAIKELIFNQSRSDELKREFLREARILSSMNHPSVVRMFGVCEHGSNLFLVTELLEQSLQDLITTGQQPSTVVCLAIAHDVAAGMCFLHALDVIHRDLKPGNVLLDEQLRGKICDFGMARFNSQLSAKTGFMGTPAYMAPETMVSARANYDERIDVYAFGILLSEMLTWRLAYTDLGYENVFVFRDSVTQRGVRPTLDIDERDPICRELATLARRCWSADPAERPPFRQVQDALAAVQETAYQMSVPRSVHSRGSSGGLGAATVPAGAGTATQANVSIAPPRLSRRSRSRRRLDRSRRSEGSRGSRSSGQRRSGMPLALAGSAEVVHPVPTPDSSEQAPLTHSTVIVDADTGEGGGAGGMTGNSVPGSHHASRGSSTVAQRAAEGSADNGTTPISGNASEAAPSSDVNGASHSGGAAAAAAGSGAGVGLQPGSPVRHASPGSPPPLLSRDLSGASAAFVADAAPAAGSLGSGAAPLSAAPRPIARATQASLHGSVGGWGTGTGVDSSTRLSPMTPARAGSPAAQSPRVSALALESDTEPASR